MMHRSAILLLLLAGAASAAQEAPTAAEDASSHGRTLRGRVVDEAGEPLYLRVRVIRAGDRHGTSDFLTHDGIIVAENLPRGDFVLEFAHLDYQPRVLAHGIHFEYGDEDIEAVLKRGPYPLNASVWTAVTDQPATQEAVDAFPGAEYVRDKERRYRQDVGVEGVIKAPPYGPREPPYPVRVIDAAGAPVREIFVQDSNTLFIRGFGESGAATEIVTMQSNDGLYDVQHTYVHIGAEDMARELNFYAGPHTHEVSTVVLHRAAGLAVTVRDFEGNPIAGAEVGPADTVPVTQKFGANSVGPLIELTLRVVTTDDNGRAVLDDLPVDRRSFGAARPPVAGSTSERAVGPFNRASRERAAYFHADLKPGETAEVEVILPPWQEGSAAAILNSWMPNEHYSSGEPAHWMHQFTQGEHLAEEYRKSLAELRTEMTQALSPDEHAAVGREVVRRIEAAPGEFRYSDMTFLALAALLLEWQDAVPALQEWLGRSEQIDYHGRNGRPQHPGRALFLMPILHAMIALGGNDAEWFAQMAMNRDADKVVRAACVTALGMLGTDESVAAWRGLREAMQGMPLMPMRTPEDTHADRIREAIALTLFAVPGYEVELPGHGVEALPVWRIQLDETYAMGSALIEMSTTPAWDFWAKLTLRRFGEDWLVTAIESDWAGGIPQ